MIFIIILFYFVLVYVFILGEIIVIVFYVVVYLSGLIEMCVSIKFDGKDIWGEFMLLMDY